MFGNADRDVVLTYPDGREHSRVTGHRSLTRILVDAGSTRPRPTPTSAHSTTGASSCS